MTNSVFDPQLVSGAAILLSFFVGYKYALRCNTKPDAKDLVDDPSPSTSKAAGDGSEGRFFADTGDYKMVLVVRNDLKMSKGKIAAQCGHGAVGAYQTAVKRSPQLVRAWDQSGCAKVAVKADSKEQLLAIRKHALALNFNVCLIRDAGRTQVEPNSITVLAIGPARVQELDQVTGHLKLL